MAAATGQTLDLRIQRQSSPTACWAAVAASVAGFYGAAISQPEVAQRVGASLSERARVDVALDAVDCLRSFTQGPAPLSLITTELRRGNPVCAVVEWNDGGVHFVLIHGYEPQADGPWIALADPRVGHVRHRLRDFPRNYARGGRWTWTCWLAGPTSL